MYREQVSNLHLIKKIPSLWCTRICKDIKAKINIFSSFSFLNTRQQQQHRRIHCIYYCTLKSMSFIGTTRKLCFFIQKENNVQPSCSISLVSLWTQQGISQKYLIKISWAEKQNKLQNNNSKRYILCTIESIVGDL